MPNRIIKESICTSTQIAALQKDEEIFFYRLLVNCDDYGLLDARPAILRAKCFPLLIDKVKDNDIQKWLVSLARQKLIVLYEVDGQPYLKMVTWEKHQRIRAHKSKYPSLESPVAKLLSIDGQLLSDASVIQSNPIQSESNPNPTPPTPYKEITDLFNNICKSLPKTKSLSDNRKKAIKARWTKYPSLDTFKELFTKAESSDFLTGRRGGWSCGFDWLMNETNMLKVLEGNYTDRRTGPKVQVASTKDYDALMRNDVIGECQCEFCLKVEWCSCEHCENKTEGCTAKCKFKGGESP